MKFEFLVGNPFTTSYAGTFVGLPYNPLNGGGGNDIDALVPELWAQESLAILEENMVAGMLVK